MDAKVVALLSGEIYGKTQVFGSYSDSKFDDLDKFKKLSTNPLPVTAVKVWHGDVIDCVEFVYDNNQYDKGKSPFFHGGLNGYPEEFKVNMGDFIQVIEGEYGHYPYSTEPAQRKKDVIIRLRFKTRNGKESSWYGNACGKGDQLKGTPFKIDVGKDSIICSLYGATWKGNLVLHNYIQAIGANYMTYLDAMKVLKLCGKV